MELGPEIKVDGKRPEWLKDDDIVPIRDHYDTKGRWQGTAPVRADGPHWPYVCAMRLYANHPRYTSPTPDERAVAPELVERMLNSWKDMAGMDPARVGPHFAGNWIKTAKTIVAELEDPDVTKARILVEGMEFSSDEAIALAAIKLGRSLAASHTTSRDVTPCTREQFEDACRV